MVHSAVEAVNVAGANVAKSTLKGIKVASAQSGVSFQYLLAKAAQESSFDSDARAKSSSATGLYQFTRGTWLDVVKRHAGELGLDSIAGRSVDDLLSLRSDPEVSALAAAAYARDNAAELESKLGCAPDSADLYLAHFLGPRGAGAMLNAADNAPNIYAAHVNPAAAKANPSVFYAPTGAPRTVSDVVDLIRSRFSAQMDKVSDVAASMANEDHAEAVELDRQVRQTGAPRFMPGAADMKDAVAKNDPTRMALDWYIIEELVKVMANNPMAMTEETGGNDTALPARGFAGSDWASALTDTFLDDAGLRPGASAAASHVSRAYTTLQRR
jgi:hypothetical protein